MTETFLATQQVQDLTGQGWPPAGTECCVVRGRPRLRSVHREPVGRVIEPRKPRRGADVVIYAEGNIARIGEAGCERSAGVEEQGMQAGVAQELGIPPRLHRRQAARAPR